MTELIHYESMGRVARVTLDRPPLNVLDLPMIRDLDSAMARALEDRVAVLVLGAAGSRAFSAGVAVQDHAVDRVRDTLTAFHSIFRRLYHAPFVSISKVRGQCLGGGCELALFCDITVAADSAVFGFPEIDLACFPPIAISAFPYRFGRRALELVVTGEPLSAEDAWGCGLVSRWTPRDELDEHVEELAAHLAAKSAAALALTVTTARRLWSPGFERALEDAERAYFEGIIPLADHAEGLAAFLEKRRPNYER